MTIVLQIYLTVGLALIINLVLSIFIYKAFVEYQGYDTLESANIVWINVSVVALILYVIYFILAMIWHWY